MCGTKTSFCRIHELREQNKLLVAVRQLRDSALDCDRIKDDEWNYGLLCHKIQSNCKSVYFVTFISIYNYLFFLNTGFEF